MKRILVGIVICALLFEITSYAKREEPKQLYAQSAVLMDADSGRVLFEKNGYEKKAMASTTKIMTCILALEKGEKEQKVTVSEYAARQPRVHLGMKKGEQFFLRDLLYSLMLESHNDSAVAIAEEIGGTVEGFSGMMNEKAKEIGCADTYFITPNGLDASDENGKHSTTAADLAKIMRYCIRISPKREEFLEITQTPNYTFTDTGGKRQFSCNNHNAFLNMMDGALSGKTGFTGDAGYCYVGALRQGERVFVVALLGCGWPNNKGYKWKDTTALMEYGLQNYHYQDIIQKPDIPKIAVEDGIPQSGDVFEKAAAEVKTDADTKELSFLMCEEERADVKINMKTNMKAPVREGEIVGEVIYSLGEFTIATYPLVVAEVVEKKTFVWYLRKLFELYILK